MMHHYDHNDCSLCFLLQAIALCSGSNPLRCDVCQFSLSNCLNISIIKVQLINNYAPLIYAIHVMSNPEIANEIKGTFV